MAQDEKEDSFMSESSLEYEESDSEEAKDALTILQYTIGKNTSEQI